MEQNDMNIQITEDFVSFEMAKLLKEKGFDGLCSTAYETITSKHDIEAVGISEWSKLNQIKRPTLQMTMKWLREIHHLYIQVMLDSWAYSEHLGYYIVIQNTTSDFEIMLQDYIDDVFYNTYEEACKAAIKYCLEHLI